MENQFNLPCRYLIIHSTGRKKCFLLLFISVNKTPIYLPFFHLKFGDFSIKPFGKCLFQMIIEANRYVYGINSLITKRCIYAYINQ